MGPWTRPVRMREDRRNTEALNGHSTDILPLQVETWAIGVY